jgi:speckle-type POZ protein
VEVTDVKYYVLREMLFFIYTGIASNIGKMSEDLLVAAVKYALERLKVMCEDALCFSISTHNITDTMILVHMHYAQQLKAHCLKFTA